MVCLRLHEMLCTLMTYYIHLYEERRTEKNVKCSYDINWMKMCVHPVYIQNMCENLCSVKCLRDENNKKKFRLARYQRG